MTCATASRSPASGEVQAPDRAAVLKPRTALAAAGVLVIVALALAMALRWQLALVGACYLALTTPIQSGGGA